MSKYFGTNGIRGTIDVLTPELAYKASYATGVYFKGGKILIATDARLTGPILKEKVIVGLLDAECTVFDLGGVSTPTAEFMVKKLKADGLIVITASHNPPEYNGLKIMDRNEISISKERGEEIERMIDSPPKIKMKKGAISKHNNSINDHIEAILNQIDKNKTKGKRLLLDCANGMAATIAPYLFRELGCEVTTINSHIDGNFPGRPSEPTEANVQDLINAVKYGNYDCGIAWDGDGDRVIFVDEKGEFVIGDKVFAICEILKLKEKSGEVVTTVATSRIIEDVAKKYSSKVVFTKIGAPYLSEEMAKGKAVIGGEEVGGVIWPEVSLAKDGFLTAAKIVEALSEKKLSKWLEDIPKYYNEKTKIAASETQKTKIIAKMREHAVKNKLTFIDIDGIRINFDDGWVIVRASGTENYVRVFTEAKSAKRAKDLLNDYIELVKRLLEVL
ncbi:phosphoglucosamine mutase [Candidatus Micrarchaeota archaeon]|nr:phosphoglucosamine mutase [Candidatus Micrarchaeota archaeon]